MRKPWGLLSEAEINVLKKNQCMKCRHFSKTSKNNTFLATSVCNYILNEGHRENATQGIVSKTDDLRKG